MCISCAVFQWWCCFIDKSVEKIEDRAFSALSGLPKEEGQTESTIKSSEKGKQARRVARRRRKGFEDKKRDAEGVMYAAGAFGTDTPGPSKHKKVTT